MFESSVRGLSVFCGVPCMHACMHGDKWAKMNDVDLFSFLACFSLLFSDQHKHIRTNVLVYELLLVSVAVPLGSPKDMLLFPLECWLAGWLA